MYCISEELTIPRMQDIISHFLVCEKPIMQKWLNYYNGKQLITKENNKNKVVVNYCASITDTYNGYLTGKPVTYSGENIDEVIDVLNYNDYAQEDSRLLKDALIMGKSFEINYIDRYNKTRFRNLSPLECIDIYDDSLDHELKYVIRLYTIGYPNNYKYRVDVYDDKNIYTYNSNEGYNTFELIETNPHYYGQVPVTVLDLEESVFNKIISLQDTYNKLVSEEVTSFESFCDAYLILKGVTTDKESMEEAKENRVFMIDNDASAEYLTKNISDAQIENLLNNLDSQIYKISCAPNFCDDLFANASGESLKWKLVGFETRAATIVDELKKALQKRIELISEIISLKDGEQIWRDIKIIFTRNLPDNTIDTVTLVNALRGVCSNKTLLSQLPFIDNVDDEIEQIKKENEEQYSLYRFDYETNETE